MEVAAWYSQLVLIAAVPHLLPPLACVGAKQLLTGRLLVQLGSVSSVTVRRRCCVFRRSSKPAQPIGGGSVCTQGCCCHTDLWLVCAQRQLYAVLHCGSLPGSADAFLPLCTPAGIAELPILVCERVQFRAHLCTMQHAVRGCARISS